MYIVNVCVFKQKTAYEMLISDWSSDVCSSDLEADAILRAVDGCNDGFGEAEVIGEGRVEFGRDAIAGASNVFGDACIIATALGMAFESAEVRERTSVV